MLLDYEFKALSGLTHFATEPRVHTVKFEMFNFEFKTFEFCSKNFLITGDPSSYT